MATIITTGYIYSHTSGVHFTWQEFGSWGIIQSKYAWGIPCGKIMSRYSYCWCQNGNLWLIGPNRQILADISTSLSGQCKETDIYILLQANILTGLVNLSVDTLSASPLAAFMILVAYTFNLCMLAGLAQFSGVRIKFWWIWILSSTVLCMYGVFNLDFEEDTFVYWNRALRAHMWSITKALPIAGGIWIEVSVVYSHSTREIQSNKENNP